jgi:aldose 1-epimerase
MIVRADGATHPVDPVHLRVERLAAGGEAGFISATILPDRSMMLLHLQARLGDGREIAVITAPPLDEALDILRSEPADTRGNASFSMGGAVLLPFANRIRGSLKPDGRFIRTTVLGEPVDLPANGGGKAADAERCAIHGLFLATPVTKLQRATDADGDAVTGSVSVGNFGGHWLSSLDVTVRHALRADSYTIETRATNVGDRPLPIGLGWHPYFNIPSGDRRQTRIHIPCAAKLEIDDYDNVFPTGRVTPVAGTSFDFSQPGGRALDDSYLDDCFVDLQKATDGDTVVQIWDPTAGYSLRIIAPSPHVAAIQVYAPPTAAYVAIEPQFNWTDPYGAEWPRDTDTGMVVLAPGDEVMHMIQLQLQPISSD